MATLEGLFAKRESRLRAYATRVLRDYDEGAATHAEDAVQQALLWMLGELRRGSAPASERHLLGALYRATRNFALQALVANGLMVPLHVRTARAMAVGFADDVFPTTIDAYETAEQRAALIGALRFLPPRERDVYLRLECRGDSQDDVADELGMRKPQVALTLYKARNRLAWHLEHGDRPYYGNGASGRRKSLVRQAKRTEADILRDKMASNRRRYHARKLETLAAG